MIPDTEVIENGLVKSNVDSDVAHFAVSQPDGVTAHRPLGEALVGKALLSEDELQRALDLQSQKGLRLGESLKELGLMTEEQLLPYIENQLGLPAVRLREGLIDPKSLNLLPRPLAERLRALPLIKVRQTLVVAMCEPQDLQRTDEIERITGLRVRPVFAFRDSIESMSNRCYEEGFEVDAVTADMESDAVEVRTDVLDFDVTSVESIVDGSPIINLVNYLVLQGIRQNASDIHVEPGRRHSIVRFRVDGRLREVIKPRRDIHPAIVSRVKVMARMDIAEHRLPQDGRCQVVVEGKEVDLRISTLPTVLGEKVVLRILDRQRVTFNLDLLGLAHDMLVELKRLFARPHGLLLVTGPTGSGKTTTLYSALELIKSVQRNIVTVEDPVEYQLELINQVQTEEAKAFSFADALRSILRQDPDVIMVGEIRDAETAQVAVQAALTGHLVLSTLHTNDSISAVSRLMDMGLLSYKVASSLIGVVAQRLVRTICPECRTTHFASEDVLKSLHYKGDIRRAFVRGEGCEQCFDTGYIGRIGIYEVLSITPELRRLIAEEAPLDELRDEFRHRGGRTLLQEGLRLADEAITSLEEVARVASID